MRKLLMIVCVFTWMHASLNDFVLEMIHNDLEKALNLYQIGESRNAQEELKFALYHGYRNTGLKSQIEKERSFEEARAIEEQFIALQSLVKKPEQLAQLRTHIQTLESQLGILVPTLSPLSKRAALKNWHRITQEIDDALHEAIALYQTKATKQAIAKVQSVYFDIFENSGMEEAILALSEDKKLKAEQRFRVLSEMMKKGESASTLLHYTNEIKYDLTEIASLLTPKELSAEHAVFQKRIPLVQWLISSLFVLLPMGGWWLVLRRQRNRD